MPDEETPDDAAGIPERSKPDAPPARDAFSEWMEGLSDD